MELLNSGGGGEGDECLGDDDGWAALVKMMWLWWENHLLGECE